jgi:hypothetical protein
MPTLSTDISNIFTCDQQERVFGELAVAEKLLVGVFQVLIPTFVFPSKTPELPDVGKSMFGLLRSLSTVAHGEEFHVLLDPFLE